MLLVFRSVVIRLDRTKTLGWVAVMWTSLILFPLQVLAGSVTVDFQTQIQFHENIDANKKNEEFLLTREEKSSGNIAIENVVNKADLVDKSNNTIIHMPSYFMTQEQEQNAYGVEYVLPGRDALSEMKPFVDWDPDNGVGMAELLSARRRFHAAFENVAEFKNWVAQREEGDFEAGGAGSSVPSGSLRVVWNKETEGELMKARGEPQVKALSGSEKRLPGSASLKMKSDKKYGSLRGRIRFPDGTDASQIVIRIAGTRFELSPDAEGFFEFSNLPVGSKFHLLVWDSQNAFSRRYVPVSVGNKEYQIHIESVDVTHQRAVAFGVFHQADKGGMCAYLSGAEQAAWKGAFARISKGQADGPFYLNDAGMPDKDLDSFSDSGGVCFFNVASSQLKVVVDTTSGYRREFSVGLLPSTFETIDWDLRKATYRPVVAQELLDSSDAVYLTQRSMAPEVGDVHQRNWLLGHEAGVWTDAASTAFKSDGAYAALDSGREDLAYLPRGAEWQDLTWSQPHVSSLTWFQNFSEDELSSGRVEELKEGAVVSVQAPLVLKTLALDDGRIPGLQLNEGLGNAFVSVNLAALDLDYQDAALVLRDPWTGKKVADFQFVPQSGKNPRYLRGFFTGLPEGEFVLTISSRTGEVKWIDNVTSQPDHMQVVTVRE